jgi:large subunit ribosomal protein L24
MVLTTSSQPRKQRKARYNAPHHVRGSFLNAPLSKELQEKHGKKRIRVVKGDTVRVLRGDEKGTTGIVDEIRTTTSKIIVHGVGSKKADGTEVPRPVDPSKVEITKLHLDDQRRAAKLGGAE